MRLKQVLKEKEAYIFPTLRCNFDCFMCGQPHDSPLVHEQKIYDENT